MDAEHVAEHVARVLAHAAGYAARGWAMVALHDVASGSCSCARPESEHERGQWGKHPRSWGWRAAPLRGLGAVEAAWALEPTANIGVVMGRASRLWALDVDPDHGGDARLAELEAIHGPLPSTWEARTGSGGRHLYWLAGAGDDSGWLPTNAKGALPLGLDVRGEGGQVVAPPSVSAKGPYELVSGAEPVVAPVWLSALVIGPPPRELGRDEVGDPGWLALGGDVVAGPREVAYARSAMGALLAELRVAGEGARNDTAFRAACRLVELVNAGWLSGEWAREAWLGACEAASGNGARPFPPAEAEGVWRSALTRVGSREAVMPPSEVGGEAHPFGTGAMVASGALSSGSGEAGAALSAAVTDPDPWEAAVAVELARLRVAREARRRLDEQGSESVASLRAALLDRAGLASAPTLAPLVSGWLWRDTLARVVGPSGVGKSLVALDLAGRVGSGLEWAGRRVARGGALYICAEGAGGLRARVMAWESLVGAPMSGVAFLPRPVQLGDRAGWAALVELAVELAPALIVGDTQARLSVGINENDATEMGVAVEALEAMRRATGACVLLVHHTGHAEGRARGSGAVHAAVQTEVMVGRLAGGRVSVSAHPLRGGKQKDREPAGDLVFEIVSVALPIVDEWGEPVSGACLAWRQDAPALAAQAEAEVLGERLGAAALACAEVFAGGNGGTKAEIHAVVVGERGIVKSKSTWYRVWNELLERKILCRVRGTNSWRYVSVDQRSVVIEPVGFGDEPAAYWAP